MARLNLAVVIKKPPPTARAQTVPSPNTSSISLTSAEDLTRLLEQKDVDDLKKCRDVNVLLAKAQGAILARTDMSEAVTSQGASDIETIWNLIATYEKKHPAVITQIQQWRKELNEHLGDKKIDYWLALAQETRDRITTYDSIVRKNWRVSAMEILEPQYYSGKQNLSKGMMQTLAELSRLTTQEEGQKLILESIDSRCRLRARANGVSKHRVIALIDIKSSVKQARERKGVSPRPRKKLKKNDTTYHGSHTILRSASVAPSQSAHDANGPNPGSSMLHQDQQSSDKDIGHGSAASPKDRNKTDSIGAASSDGETYDPHDESNDIHHSAVPCRAHMDDADGKSQRSTDLKQRSQGGMDMDDRRSGSRFDFMNTSPEIGRGYLKSNDPAQDDREFESNDEKDLFEGSIDGSDLNCNHDKDDDEDIGTADIYDISNLPPSTPFPTSWGTQRNYESPPPNLITDTRTFSVPPLTATMTGPLVEYSDSLQAAEDQRPPTPTSPHMPSNVPTSDLAGALSSLQQGQRLSATALEMSLAAVERADTVILDPQLYDMDTDRVGRVPSIEDSTSLVLLPINHSTKEHWTLAVFRVGDGIVEHYDSLSGYDPPAKSVRRLLKMAGELRKQSWRFEQQTSAQQTNGYDCGVFVLKTAVFVLAGMEPPARFDCVIWRLILRTMVRGKFEEGDGDGSDEDSSNHGEISELANASFPHDAPDLDFQTRAVLKDVQRHRATFQHARKKVEAARQAIEVLTQLRSQCNARLSAAYNEDQDMQQEMSIHKGLIDGFARLPSLKSDHILTLMNEQRADAMKKHNKIQRKLGAAREQITKVMAAVLAAEKIRDGRMAALREIDEAQRYHAERALKLKKGYQASIRAIDDMCREGPDLLFR